MIGIYGPLPDGQLALTVRKPNEFKAGVQLGGGLDSRRCSKNAADLALK